ncbi:hypothetical protein FTO74_17175 [Granulicella sp. WH15]|uniref:hypothetical protein n=1 Tax=Granulicella sp. WH15 TaxID=2602070 RepID=UPI00136727B1|nr:hypothetical protein [Granulicella sp. WH15]QHN04900.1 hypothetical protein FTO74_17175 [Granulicella sp. WH15]
MRILIPALLLIFQVCAIGYARTVPTRYFCWAPYDTQTEYTARAVVNGHELTAEEFRARYRRPAKGGDNRSPQHVIDMLEQAEAKHEKLGDKTTIDMDYHVNGKELRQWHWPESQPRS